MSAMEATDAGPVAARLRKPSWRDPRLAIGILLVLGAIVAGTWLVTSAAKTTGVYAAASALVPGQTLQASDLRVVEVRLENLEDTYLLADPDAVDGLVVTRTIAAGELVPLSALATDASLQVRAVSLQLDGLVPDGVVAGSVVDVWFTPKTGEPTQLGSAWTVAQVATSGGGFVGSTKPVVAVLVPLTDLPAVLSAQAADGTITVVPVPGVK